ncbi:hypothetical protein PHMEG_00025128 [Phytophthora megakarya]|uniref:Uncharacterized protein n=1 Tax=Phytophthora megakarya TaxID=4795 RepID=A0A225VCR3_9STRA|nr:hypothetical protein PHMEG_00025128 [Phytophthora megakarya]
MNGFNYELMAAFKCNHDIQILLGGSGVTDRIYYCCKYITKQQKQVDSQVAVAVAALDRRRQRENNAASLGGDLNAHDMAQKRVAALAYNMTNRVEIAGPLAALYIYRGSCCYSSAKTATLLLGEIFRQLTTSEVFSCSLVSDNTDSDVQSTFRAVGPLDDYSFRPKALEAVNLYEFTMKLTVLESEAKKSYQLYKDSVYLALSGTQLWKNAASDSDWSDAEVWMHAYEQWKPKRSEFVVEIMNNMDDFHSGFEKAKARSDQAAVGPQSDEQMNNVANDNDDIYSDTMDGDFNESIVDEGPTEDLRRLWDDYENEGVKN